jgi:hypothetical protein
MTTEAFLKKIKIKILPCSIFIRVHGHHHYQDEVKDSFMHYWDQLQYMNCLPQTLPPRWLPGNGYK